jgi:hypothetical protein
LGGAAVSSRGNGQNAPRFADVNHDSLMDLVLSFDARDVHLDGNATILEGSTTDGVSFRGTEMVKTTGPSRFGVAAALGDSLATSVFSVKAASPQHGAMELAISLPEVSPASVEVYDINGRRVLSHDIDAGDGQPRALEWRGGRSLPSGLYWVRVTQGQLTATRRIILLH